MSGEGDQLKSCFVDCRKKMPLNFKLRFISISVAKYKIMSYLCHLSKGARGTGQAVRGVGFCFSCLAVRAPLSVYGTRYTRLLVLSRPALACPLGLDWTGPLGLDWASQGKDRWRQELFIPGAYQFGFWLACRGAG